MFLIGFCVGVAVTSFSLMIYAMCVVSSECSREEEKNEISDRNN